MFIVGLYISLSSPGSGLFLYRYDYYLTAVSGFFTIGLLVRFLQLRRPSN